MKWEYKILKMDTTGLAGGKFDEHQLERTLNEWGQQDWELVNAFDTNQAFGESRHIVTIFKRLTQ